MIFTPSADYKGLLIQARALHNLVNSLEAQLTVLRDKLQEKDKELAMCDNDALDAERKTNTALTELVLELEGRLEDYKWLVENQGSYEIRADNSTWLNREGEKVFNKFSMSYKGTIISFTAELGLDGCIKYFKETV